MKREFIFCSDGAHDPEGRKRQKLMGAICPGSHVVRRSRPVSQRGLQGASREVFGLDFLQRVVIGVATRQSRIDKLNAIQPGGKHCALQMTLERQSCAGAREEKATGKATGPVCGESKSHILEYQLTRQHPAVGKSGAVGKDIFSVIPRWHDASGRQQCGRCIDQIQKSSPA